MEHGSAVHISHLHIYIYVKRVYVYRYIDVSFCCPVYHFSRPCPVALFPVLVESLLSIPHRDLGVKKVQLNAVATAEKPGTTTSSEAECQ